MTSMWPYLRLRETEIAKRRRLYEGSFIARFFRKVVLLNPIATRVRASPDNPKQLSVAVKYANLTLDTRPGVTTIDTR